MTPAQSNRPIALAIRRKALLGVLNGLGMGLLIPLLHCDVGLAQIVPDATLSPNNTAVSAPDSLNFEITGGTRSDDGTQLFHSFEQFSVPTGGEAVFKDDSLTTENIFSRVTGGRSSAIGGSITVTSSANLFLINPNGIIFGENASLNVGGSFIATTADSVLFNEGKFKFSAVELQQPLLSLAVPTGLQFGNFPGNIRVDSAEISGAAGRTVAFIGGDVTLNAATVVAPQGSIELGGVAPNTLIDITPVRNADSTFIRGWTFNYQDSTAFQDIRLVNGTFVTTGNSGGSIQLQGRQVRIAGGSQIRVLLDSHDGTVNSLSSSNASTGNLILRASESVDLVGELTQREQVTGLFNEIGGDASGQGRELLIETPRLSIRNGAQVSTNTFGRGQGVALTVRATDSITLDGVFFGQASDGTMGIEPSGLFSRASGNQLDDSFPIADGPVAAGGRLTIETGQLRVTNGAQVSTSTRSENNAGDLAIVADSIVLDGRVLDATGSDVLADDPEVQDKNTPSGLFASVEQSESTLGNGGDITIDAAQLTIRRGAQVATTAQGDGGGGTLRIMANSIRIAGASADAQLGGSGRSGLFVSAEPTFRTNQQSLRPTTANAGNLIVEADDLIVEKNGLISASNFGADNIGGTVQLTIDRLVLRSGGQIGAGSLLGQTPLDDDRGDGGRIIISTTETIDISGSGQLDTVFPSAILTRTEGSGGDAGDITIDDAGSGQLTVTVRDGAEITASTTGSDGANAGNINITAAQVSLEAGGSISSEVGEAADGTGGDIILNTGSLTLSDRASISSSSLRNSPAAVTSIQPSDENFRQGNAGDITIVAEGRVTVEDSDITTEAVAFAGGEIDIRAAEIRLVGDGDIRTNVQSGTEGGGDITLTAASILAFGDSDILAFAQDGAGGNISLNSPAFFGENFDIATLDSNPAELDGNGRVDINASGAVAGVVSLPDVSFIQNSLADLPERVISTESLIANSCVARNESGESTFVVTGAGGLPQQPGESAADYSTGDVMPIPEAASPRWQTGMPIVEAQNIYQLPTGELVISHACTS